MVWLLTGIPPAHASMRASKRIDEQGAVLRIVLDIDPTTPAREVAAFYRRVRGPRLGRSLSTRQARLASFVEDRPPELWQRRMAAWNALHPEPGGRYESVSNFKRDATKARQRLLRRGI